MRIIAGRYRGRILKSPPSLQVRPTSDRLRETLFNVIAPRIQGARLLDLCAGSGAVGIEALSRGATHVTFVDRSRKMCALIKENLDLCSVPEKEAEVVLGEALNVLRRTKSSGTFDIVFLDPPYSTNYEPILKVFSSRAEELLNGSGLLIAEHHHKKDLPSEIGRLFRSRVLKQGDSTLSFYQIGRSEPK